MNIKSWPRLNTYEEKHLREERVRMGQYTKVWERFVMLPIFFVSFVLTGLLIFYGYSEFVGIVLRINIIMFAVYGFTRFPGRSMSLFMKRLDLKKHQMLRHANWHVRREIRNIMKRVFRYRRWKEKPNEDGTFTNGTLII